MASRRPQVGRWTDWAPDPANHRYYRARQDWATGEWEYQYTEPSHPPSTPQQSAPRGEGVENLTQSFSNVHLQGNGYISDQSEAQEDGHLSYTYQAPVSPRGGMTNPVPSGPSHQPSYFEQPQSYPTSPYQDHASFSYKGKEKGHGSSSFRSRGKGPASGRKPKPKPGKVHDEGFGDVPGVDPGSEDQPPFYEVTSETSETDSVSTDHHGPAGEYESQPAATDYQSDYPQAVASDNVDNQDPTAHDDTNGQYYGGTMPDPNHQQVETEFGAQGVAEVEEEPTEYSVPSVGFPGEEEPNVENAIYQEADGYGTGLPGASSSTETEGPVYEQYGSYSYNHDTGQQTPRAVSPQMSGFHYSGNTMNQVLTEGRARGSRSQDDELFSRYIVEPSVRFQPGNVFKIYWSEPLGDGMNATVRSYMDKKGEKFHYSFRRFIVVASDEGHSTCVPILTYGHRACTKKGVKAQKHGIVYQTGNRPFRLHGEPELGFQPARVELFERTEKLDKESRVNYSKLVTVEHNYRVFFIGHIHPRDFSDIVGPAVDICWDKKRRHHR